MRLNLYPLTIIAVFLFCACSLPVRKSPPQAPPFKKATAAGLSAEDANKVESLYYKAVGSYSGNDMAAALGYLKELSVIDPAYAQAEELREKIKSVSGTR